MLSISHNEILFCKTIDITTLMNTCLYLSRLSIIITDTHELTKGRFTYTIAVNATQALSSTMHFIRK